VLKERDERLEAAGNECEAGGLAPQRSGSIYSLRFIWTWARKQPHRRGSRSWKIAFLWVGTKWGRQLRNTAGKNTVKDAARGGLLSDLRGSDIHARRHTWVFVSKKHRWKWCIKWHLSCTVLEKMKIRRRRGAVGVKLEALIIEYRSTAVRCLAPST